VADLKRIGSNQANGRATAVLLSLTRHLSTATRPDASPDAQYEPPVADGVAYTAERAGRSASSGVLDSRSSAITAERTILSRWSPFTGGAHLAAAGCHGRFTTMLSATVGEMLPGRFQPLQRPTLPRQRHWSLARQTRFGKRGEVGQSGGRRQATETFTASTRGKGVR
jgi:hypothetical protein